MVERRIIRNWEYSMKIDTGLTCMYNNSSVGGKVVHYSMWKMSLICKLIGLRLTKHECWQGFCLSKPHMSERPVSKISGRI